MTIPDPHGTKNEQHAWLIVNGWGYDGKRWLSRKRKTVTTSSREACDIELAAQRNEQLRMAEGY